MKCPNCGEGLADNATYCPCGWKPPELELTPPPAESKLPTCPDCGEDRDRRFTFCRGCGFSYVQVPVGWDPYHRRCAHLDRGQRCLRLGTLSHNTMQGGPNGRNEPSPRWCRQHFQG